MIMSSWKLGIVVQNTGTCVVHARICPCKFRNFGRYVCGYFMTACECVTAKVKCVFIGCDSMYTMNNDVPWIFVYMTKSKSTSIINNSVNILGITIHKIIWITCRVGKHNCCYPYTCTCIHNRFWKITTHSIYSIAFLRVYYTIIDLFFKDFIVMFILAYFLSLLKSEHLILNRPSSKTELCDNEK